MSQHSNHINDDSPLKLEAKAAAKRFGFTPISASRFSSSPRCFKLRATDSENKHTELFLKWTEEDPLTQTWIQEKLFDNGFRSLPHLYRSVDSSTILAQGGKYWTCQPFMGNEFSYNWLDFDCNSQHCFQAGQTLALIHATGSKILKNKERVPSPRIVSATIQKFVDRFERTSHRLSNSSSSSSQVSAPFTATEPLFPKEKRTSLELAPALEVISSLPFDHLRKRAKNLAGRLIEFEKDSLQTINHGDYHPGNILFTSSGLDAVCDWEYACIGSPIYDISCALFMFCFQSPLEGKVDTDYFSARRTEAFLDGYTGTGAIPKSMSKLSTYMEYIHLLMLEWACSEILKSDSHYVKNPQFPKFLVALSVICQF